MGIVKTMKNKIWPIWLPERERNGHLGTVNGLGQHRERRPRGDNQVLISLSRLFHFTISNPRITPATVMFMVWPPSPRVYVQVDLMYQHTGNHLSATPITMTH